MLNSQIALTNTINHIWLELTHRCNLRCSHCYSNSSPEVVDDAPLSLDEYASIMKDARALGATSIQFIGGEPILAPLLPDLLRMARQKGFEFIEVYTNLVSLPSSVRTALVEVKANVATSLYGDIAEIHDAATNQPGSFVKTVGNIKALLDIGSNIRVGVITPSEDDSLSNPTVAFAHYLGVHHVSMDFARPFGRLAPIKQQEVDAIKGVCGHCWTGKICIDPSGNVSPCIMSKTWSCGSIRTTSLLDLVTQGRVASIQDRMSSLYQQEVGEVLAGCDPEDRCPPGACKPQVGGGEGCVPKQLCAPDNYRWNFL